MASLEAEDWRVGLSLLDRFKYMFDTRYGSDVEFMVGRKDHQKLIRAHRVFLVAGSSVFDDMLTGCTDHSMIVDDVEPAVFEEMLRYLYYETVDMKDDNVMALLDVASKFAISGLLEKCVKHLGDQLDTKNVCKTFHQAVKHEARNLERMCLDLMCRSAQTIMESEDFLTLSNKALEKFVEPDSMSVKSESEVFSACLRWADEKCKTASRALNDENRRAMLGPVLTQIRFPTMSMKEFAELTNNSTLLTTAERAAIYDYIVLGGQTSEKTNDVMKQFNCKSRVISDAGIEKFKLDIVTQLSDGCKEEIRREAPANVNYFFHPFDSHQSSDGWPYGPYKPL